MTSTATYPMARERNLILGSLRTLAAASWALLAWQRTATDDGMGLTMGMGAPLFMAIWVVMMVAMMFPAAAPMILTFARVHGGKRRCGQPFVPTLMFVSSYLCHADAATVMAAVCTVQVTNRRHAVAAPSIAGSQPLMPASSSDV